jgi:type VI secretion system FHA domain protein
MSLKIGDIELRCTLIADREEAPAREFVAPTPAAVPSSDWWAAAAPVPSPPPALASLPLEPADLPSVADWYVDDHGSAQQGMDEQAVLRPGAEEAAPFAGAFGSVLPPADSSLDWTKGLSVPAAAAPVHTPVPASPVNPVPLQAAGPPASTAAVGANEASAVMATILQAAGLRADIAALHARECSPEAIGGLLAQLLAGLITTLGTRRAVKNTLRVSHTELRIEGNNPLKQAVTPPEALLGLIQSQRPGYLAAEPAIRSVFKDLADHELALVEGAEEALKHVVEMMSPEAVEQALGHPDAKPAFGLRGSRDARAWALYRSRHAELLGGNRAFATQFLPAFRDAYEACLMKLRRRGT